MTEIGQRMPTFFIANKKRPLLAQRSPVLKHLERLKPMFSIPQPYVHDNFQAWLDQNRLTQQDLADVVGVKAASISYYVSHNILFPTRYIVAWADAYKLSTSEIVDIFLQPAANRAHRVQEAMHA